MLKDNQLQKIINKGRVTSAAQPGDEDLGPLAQLPGTWKNEPALPGRGWNMIALPFAAGQFNYRLLLNQYNEELTFGFVDKGVPNRGLNVDGSTTDTDQFVATLDYKQSIVQIAAEDNPVSGLAGPADLPIHLEPGLWLHMLNKATNGVDIARLATIPHGDSVLALGRHSEISGPPTIPDIDGLPIGVTPDLQNNPYLAPYKHFNDNLFQGLFNPVKPNELLKGASNVVKTTVLEVDTELETGGVVNIPFVTRQAEPTQMKSTFWIEELSEKDAAGNPKLRLQYSQTVFLEFFERRDGKGLIRWPHVSINTLEKVV